MVYDLANPVCCTSRTDPKNRSIEFDYVLAEGSTFLSHFSRWQLACIALFEEEKHAAFAIPSYLFIIYASLCYLKVLSHLTINFYMETEQECSE